MVFEELVSASLFITDAMVTFHGLFYYLYSFKNEKCMFQWQLWVLIWALGLLLFQNMEFESMRTNA